MSRAAIISPLVLMGCVGASDAGNAVVPGDYRGIQVTPLDGPLVRVDVKMAGTRDRTDLRGYADCAVAGYAMTHGLGFARHLRTVADKKGGVWQADAVYTISPSLPRGLATIDAEIVAAACAESGIPTV